MKLLLESGTNCLFGARSIQTARTRTLEVNAGRSEKERDRRADRAAEILPHRSALTTAPLDTKSARLEQRLPRPRGLSRAPPRPWGGVENPESSRLIRNSKTLSQADNTVPPFGAAVPDSDSRIPLMGALIPLKGNRNSDNGNRIPANDNSIPVNDNKFP